MVMRMLFIYLFMVCNAARQGTAAIMIILQRDAHGLYGM